MFRIIHSPKKLSKVGCDYFSALQILKLNTMEQLIATTFLLDFQYEQNNVNKLCSFQSTPR